MPLVTPTAPGLGVVIDYGTDPIIKYGEQRVVGNTPRVLAAVAANELTVVDANQNDTNAPTQSASNAVDPATTQTADTRHAAYSGITAAAGAVIALRFDDTRATDFTVTYPELKSRGFPYGIAAIKENLDRGDAANATYCTRAQVAEMQLYGGEVMLHAGGDINAGQLDGFTGQNPLAAFEQGLLGTNLTNLRASGYNVDSFVQPGEWTGNWFMDTVAKWQMDRGSGKTVDGLVRKNLTAAEAYLPDTTGANSNKPWPSQVPYGHAYIGVNGISSLATLEGYVDSAIQYGGAVELVFHSYNIGAAGELTLANFQALLDYIKTKRDAGLLTVLSPTGLAYAQPGTRTNLLRTAGFEEYVAGAVAGQISPNIWQTAGGTGGTIATGGRTGTNALQVDSTNSSHQFVAADMLRTVTFEGWVKNTAAGPNTARVIMRQQDFNGVQIPTGLQVDKAVSGVTNAGWTKVVASMNVRRDAKTVRVWLLATNGTLIWDDVALYKV